MQFRSQLQQELGRLCPQHPCGDMCSEAVCYVQSHKVYNDMHFHDYPELGLCLKGNGLFFVESRIYPFSVGTVTYFPAGMMHIAQSPETKNSEWIFIWIDDKRLNITTPDTEAIADSNECASIMKLMYQHLLSTDVADRDCYFHLVSALLCSLKKNFDTDHGYTTFHQGQKSLAAIKYIAENYSDEINISELAEQCYMSESTLRRCFKTETGLSPAEYILSVRLQMAKKILQETNLPIIDIAQQCGFSVISTFNRQFRQVTGRTPTEYRRDKQR